MNMNFIAFSSRAKLLAPGSWLLSRLAVARWATTKWPAFRRRHRRPGFPRRRRPPPSWTSRSCRSRQYIPGRWTSRPSRCGRMAADTSLSFRGGRNRQPRWLRAEVGEACALERSDAPIRIGAQLGREGVQGLERALDRGAVGGGLRSQEANPRQRDIEGAKPPASSPIDELTRLREERAGSRAVTGGQLGVRERREDARLVPQRGAPITSERERPLEYARGRGEVAVRELASAHQTRHKPSAVERPTASRSPATCVTSVRARSAVARAGARRPTASCAWASTERISNSNTASDPSANSVARSAHARYCPTSPASPHRRP